AKTTAFANNLVHLPQSDAEAQTMIQSLARYYGNAEQAAHSLSFGSRPPPLSPRSKENPWNRFEGHYVVKSTKCSKLSFEVVGFEVKRSGDGLRLIELWDNGRIDRGGLYDGADMILAGSAVHVSGNEKSASRFAELGDRWNVDQMQWSSDTFKIEMKEQGLFKITATHRWKNLDGGYETSSCMYAAVRQ
ncbi:MAG TPA: hypothetical protein VM432_05445, partial [Bdellovibrionales bacterium]|nr:hypothetical protein [Bdellovibrionales bacterium]